MNCSKIKRATSSVFVRAILTFCRHSPQLILRFHHGHQPWKIPPLAVLAKFRFGVFSLRPLRTSCPLESPLTYYSESPLYGCQGLPSSCNNPVVICHWGKFLVQPSLTRHV